MVRFSRMTLTIFPAGTGAGAVIQNVSPVLRKRRPQPGRIIALIGAASYLRMKFTYLRYTAAARLSA